MYVYVCVCVFIVLCCVVRVCCLVCGAQRLEKRRVRVSGAFIEKVESRSLYYSFSRRVCLLFLW